jgi:hypothetical protein
MASLPKVLATLLSGRSDANVRFADVVRVLKAMGFAERIRGDHHIFTREGVVEILNLQPLRGGKVKPYQAKQVRNVIIRYGLGVGDKE